MKDIIQKLQKLHVMAERGTTSESENAKRIIGRLLDKYNLDESVLAERTERVIRCSRDTRPYVIYACGSLGLELFEYKGRRNSPLLVRSTAQEFEVVYQLSLHINSVFKQKQKELRERMHSYMSGFIVATYPREVKNPLCPKCEEPLSYSESECRYVCSCGFKGKKLRPIHEEDYFNGKASSGRLLTSQTA